MPARSPTRRFGRWFAARDRYGLILLCVFGLFALADFTRRAAVVEPRRDVGIRRATVLIRALMPPDNPVVLIASDPNGQAAALSEMLMTEPGVPRSFAIPGSRLLGAGGYNNSEYVPRFQTVEELMSELDRLAVPLVLLRNDPQARVHWSHLDQIEEAARRYPERWKLVHEDLDLPAPVRAYVLTGNSERHAAAAEIMKITAPTALRK